MVSKHTVLRFSVVLSARRYLCALEKICVFDKICSGMNLTLMAVRSMKMNQQYILLKVSLKRNKDVNGYVLNDW
jgi:hypothetical protein